MGNNAVFYIAKGEQYIKEVEVSANSLHRVMPDIPVHIFTFRGDYFTIASDSKCKIHTIKYNDRENWYSNSIKSFGLALEVLNEYDHLIYLDSDTYVCKPFYEVFTLLKRFEFVATHAPGRLTCGSVMDFDFPADFHIGLVGLRNCDNIKNLLSAWLTLYQQHQANYGDNDQGALRDAIWYNDISTYILPPEFCFRFIFGGFVCGSVRVLHGRAKDYSAVSKIVNKAKFMRTFDKGIFRGM